MRVAALLLALAGPVAADEAAIRQAWEDWLIQNFVTQSALAITKDGELVSDHGWGMLADASVPLASLSKAITGACVLALVDEGRLALSDRLADVFADAPDRVGQGGDIRIDALLTHTSGLDFDRTQTALNPTLWGGGDLHRRVTDLALSRSIKDTEFFYNNENYAILGSVIMQVTGQSVEDACGPRILSDYPTAAPDRRTGGGLAWMGWSMSVADYARFAATLTPADDWPKAPLGEGAFYGPGVLTRDQDDGTNLWHLGALCVLNIRDFGSYFYALENGWGVAVWFDICAVGDEARRLDRALTQAAYSDD